MAKIAATVAGVCLMLIVVGVVGVGQVSIAQDRLRGMHRVNLQATSHLDDVAFDFSQVLHEVDGLVLAGNSADARQALERIRSVNESLDRDWTARPVPSRSARPSRRSRWSRPRRRRRRTGPCAAPNGRAACWRASTSPPARSRAWSS